MKAVLCERWGDPEEVLQVRDLPMPPEPKRGEAARCAWSSARSTPPTC